MFNTLAYARNLKKAGFTDEQAEAMANGLVELASATLATKEDIAELKADIARLEGKFFVLLWVVSGVGFAIFLTLVALLFRLFWPFL